MTSKREKFYKQQIAELKAENAQLKKRIQQLERRIENLERLLGMNSKNSSKPPSSDLPGISAASPKKRPKKRGARKGHEPHLRELLPQEKVTRRIELEPQVCTCGGTAFEKTPKFEVNILALQRGKTYNRIAFSQFALKRL